MHTEALTEAGLQLLPVLPSFDGFVLAGGTALALQIGHRVSVDFDFFTPDAIRRPLFDKATRIFAPLSITPLVNTKDELTILVGSVKVSFIRYPFHVIMPLVQAQGLSLLSVAEIGATKAYTIGRRGSYRDYVDLYAVVSKGYASLTEIVTLAERKFGNAFNSRLFAEQLLFFDDIDDYEIDFLTMPVSREELLSFFENELRTWAAEAA